MTIFCDAFKQIVYYKTGVLTVLGFRSMSHICLKEFWKILKGYLFLIKANNKAFIFVIG